jgi:hypothetical protein
MSAAEQAIDSCDAMFACSIHPTNDQATSLATA